MNHEPSLLEDFADVLCRHGVEFIVIGGQASTLYGVPLVTYDVDLCYRRTPSNLESLAKALAELGVSLRGAPKDLPFNADARTLSMGANFTFDTRIGPLDLLGHVEPIGDYEALASHAESLAGHGLRFISLDDLIRVKKHVGRPKDLEVLRYLLAIKKLRDQRNTQPPASP